MKNVDSFFNFHSQNNKLPVRLIAPGFGHLTADVAGQYGLTHRKPYYFFFFMLDGSARHGVDLQEFSVQNNELLFILPHQIHQLPGANHGKEYFKLGFGENCLALLPKQYPFLINPFNTQKILFSPGAAARLKSIFGILRDLLTDEDANPELILAHLNSLLTEINAVYFSGTENPAANKLSKYIHFKLFVEDNLTDAVPVQDIAEKLNLNTNSLYYIVKQYSGYSPKEFIINRLILEAKRRLYYQESSSIKELAYDLGFNDPEYFSRLFRKNTGQTITSFIQDSSGN